MYIEWPIFFCHSPSLHMNERYDWKNAGAGLMLLSCSVCLWRSFSIEVTFEESIISLTNRQSFNFISIGAWWRGVNLRVLSISKLRKKIRLFTLNPLTAKLFNLNFYPLEVVSRWRDPQLQVSENYSDLTKWRSTLFKYCWLISHFIFNMLNRWYIMC